MKIKELSIVFHQLLSFNKFFASTTRSSTVFCPGCSLMSLDPSIIKETYKILKTKDKNMGISSFCCGKPSQHIEGGINFKLRLNKITKILDNNSTKTIYTACPNCFNTLEKYTNYKIISIWPIIDEFFPQDKINILKNQEFILHDPCAARKNNNVHISIRNILNKLGITIIEFTKNKNKSLCCGKKNMIMALNNKIGMQILNLTSKEAVSKNLVSYCATCVDSFKLINIKSFHILELLFHKISKRKPSWLNRFKLSFFIKKLKY
ncbi:MAG: heterodisulfide reductase-related iron-sulfur binding cluster [Fusobacteriaceae bacterium]